MEPFVFVENPNEILRGLAETSAYANGTLEGLYVQIAVTNRG